MKTIPSGTVTFLFTDIEGSTGLWERFPQQMKSAFERQEAILRETVAQFGGYAYKMIGDAFQVAFKTAYAGLCAALEAQRRLHIGDIPLLASSYFLLVRIALSQGDLLEAEANIHKLVEITRVSGFDQVGLSYMLGTLAMFSRRKGQLKQAVVLFSAVDHLCAWVSHMIPKMDRRERQADLDALRKELSAEEFAEAWNEGQSLDLDQALAYALEGNLNNLKVVQEIKT